LTIAVPKGLFTSALGDVLAKAGIDVPRTAASDRRLVQHSADGLLRFLLMKADDVPTYVEYGAADLGITGREVVLEQGCDPYRLLDLQLEPGRMVVARTARADWPDIPRIATRFPRLARRYWSRSKHSIEIVEIGGSVVTAPQVGLADGILELVPMGANVEDHGLVETDELFVATMILIANRSLFKLRFHDVAPLVERLRRAVQLEKSLAHVH
jgi:ATP phosphoribosyltransferase